MATRFFYVRIIDREANKRYYIMLAMANLRAKHGVRHNTYIGKDMMHCWSAMQFVQEARVVRQEYFKDLG